jgi:hypothetical protein
MTPRMPFGYWHVEVKKIARIQYRIQYVLSLKIKIFARLEIVYINRRL